MIGQSSYLGVALTEALRDSESFVRVWAAAALARVDPENLNAVPALVAGTRDESYFVRSLSAWHLGRLGPQHPGIQAALPELRELLNDNDPSARAEAVAALENLAGKGAPPAELKSLSAHG
jgi:HEAT repeat protein